MTTQIFRRFEVQGLDRNKVKTVTKVLRTAARKWKVALLKCTPVERPPSLQVRLQGTAQAIAHVVERIAHEGTIYEDFVDVPAGTPRGRPYPDPQPMLRMGGGPPAPRPRPNGGRPGVKAPKNHPFVTIAIVDSGIMVDHPDLRDHLWQDDGQSFHGARCMNGKVDHDLTDTDGHGTMLAGTILATAGGHPSIKLMAVKFFDGATRPSAMNAAAAIRFAVEHGADIVHLSWELGLPSDDVQAAIAEAYKADRLVVFAAGNEGANSDVMKATPSQYASDCREQAIVVMATDRYEDKKAWFSSYGENTVDIAAPGVGIITTCPFVSTAAKTSNELPGRYRTFGGTSAASACVTGAAALIKARYPALGAVALKRCLVDSVDPRQDLKCRSQGRLNLVRALTAAGQMKVPGGTVQPGSPARRRWSASRPRRSGS